MITSCIETDRVSGASFGLSSVESHRSAWIAHSRRRQYVICSNFKIYDIRLYLKHINIIKYIMFLTTRHNI